MRIKLDENLPTQLARNLEALGHDVHTVHEEGLTGKADPEVWSAAQEDTLTQDLDFSDARRFTPGLHHGILLLRFRLPSRSYLSEKVTALFREEAADLWVGCFVVATDS